MRRSCSRFVGLGVSMSNTALGVGVMFLRFYCDDLLYTRALLTMLAAVKPTTAAIIQNLISRAIDTAEGDKSIECRIFTGDTAMACLTATSERSIGFSTKIGSVSTASNGTPESLTYFVHMRVEPRFGLRFLRDTSCHDRSSP